MKVTQLYPTLCGPMDCTVHGILQARILEWVTFPSPGDLPNPGIESRSPALLVDSLPAEPQGKPVYKGQGQMPVPSWWRETSVFTSWLSKKFV